MNLGLKARPLYGIEVNTRGMKLEGGCILYQSSRKTSLLAWISQSSQCKVVVNTVDPSFNNFVIHLPFICRWRQQFDRMWDNLGRQSSTKRCKSGCKLQRTGYSHHEKNM